MTVNTPALVIGTVVGAATVAEHTVRGPNSAEKFELSLSPKSSVVTPITNTPTTIRDAVFASISGSTDNIFNINFLQPIVAGFQQATLTNLTPSIVTVDANNNVSWVSNGTASIAASTPNGDTKTVAQSVSRNNTGTTQFSHWVANTNCVSYHIQQAILNMVSGKTSTLNQWYANGENNLTANSQAVCTSTNNNITSPAVTRNPDLFTDGTGGVDITATCVMVFANGAIENNNGFPLTLVYADLTTTTNYLAMGSHYLYPVGSLLLFMDNSNNHYTGTITQVSANFAVAGLQYLYKLSFAVDNKPTTITPMKLLPANWASYLPTVAKIAGNFDLPVLGNLSGIGQVIGINGQDLRYINVIMAEGIAATYGDMMEFVGMQRWNNGEIDNPINADPNITKTSVYEPLRTWSYCIIDGDSNGPLFVPIDPAGPGYTNFVPVLLSCTNTLSGGAFYAADWAVLAPLFESFVTGSSTAVQISLSNFSTY